MASSKHIVFFGNLSTVGGQTLSEPANSSTTGAPVWSTDKTEYSHMDVLVNVKTLTGTSPTIQLSIQEQFSDVGFVETAKSSAISSTGKYILSSDGQTGQSGAANISYGFSMLGKGISKQIVSTAGGTIGTLSVDVYFIFYH